ncbi:hypothetical protein BG004_002250 [Podila humilis]|nr:hypothetical protein BG004_002250 [Podila humilis]
MPPPLPPRGENKDVRQALQSLLNVMATNQTNLYDTGSSSGRPESLNGLPAHSSQLHMSQRSSHSHSLMSYMANSSSGSVLSGGAYLDSSASAQRQYQTYEISVSRALPQTSESEQRMSWTPSVPSISSQLTSPIIDAMDRGSNSHSRPTQPSIASSSIHSLSPGCEAILTILSIQDLVRLLAFILSIAPEQWIPWHLYDFFVRPQGHGYRDLIDLLPTQSQKALRIVLVAVDLLVEYAVMTEIHGTLAETSSHSLGPAFSSTFSKARSPSMSSASGYPGGQHLRSRSDQVYPRDVVEGSSMSLTMAMSTLDHSSHVAPAVPSKRNTFGLEFSPSLTSAAENSTISPISESILGGKRIREAKRKVIVESLSGLVFRSRQDVAIKVYGSTLSSILLPVGASSWDEIFCPGREQTIPNLESQLPSSVFNARRSSVPASISTRALSATMSSVQAQGASDHERESSLQAFENLVNAYEEEYHSQKLIYPATGSGYHSNQSDIETRRGSSEAMAGMQPGMSLGRSLSTSENQSTGRGPGSGSGSKHGRILTTATSSAMFSTILETESPTGDGMNSDNVSGTNKSLSLPPWRKQQQQSLSSLLLGEPSNNSNSSDLNPRRPALASSASSPVSTKSRGALFEAKKDVLLMVESVSDTAIVTKSRRINGCFVNCDISKKQQLLLQQVSPPRLIIMEEEETVIKDTSDEEEDDDDEEESVGDFDVEKNSLLAEGEPKDEQLGQRPSLMVDKSAGVGKQQQQGDDDKVRENDLHDVLAQGLSLLKYKRARHRKKTSGTFGDVSGPHSRTATGSSSMEERGQIKDTIEHLDNDGGGGGGSGSGGDAGNPRGGGQPHQIEDEDADVSEGEV